jgi:hypothetical protein
MLVSDAHGNPVTTSGPGPAALLDDAVTAYLGFRKDIGDRLKAVFAAEPDLVLAHCLRGYFMMLFGQRAMIPRAERSLEAARAAAQTIGVTPREAAHMATLAAWVAGDFAGATGRWEAIAAEHPRDVLALKLAQYGCFYTGESKRMRDVLARAAGLGCGHAGLRLRPRLPRLRSGGDWRLCRGRTHRPRSCRAQSGRYLGRARGGACLRNERPPTGRGQLDRSPRRPLARVQQFRLSRALAPLPLPARAWGARSRARSLRSRGAAGVN